MSTLRCCATPRCPALVRSGYCDACRQTRGRERRAASPKVHGQHGRLIDFYQSRQWKDLRELVRREEPLCRQHATCAGLTEHVDHIIPRESGGPDTRENLQGLCHHCHSVKTRAEQVATARMGAHRGTGG